jgi:hypothetical protein
MMLASTIKAAVMIAAPPASGPRGGGLPDGGKYFTRFAELCCHRGAGPARHCRGQGEQPQSPP